MSEGKELKKREMEYDEYIGLIEDEEKPLGLITWKIRKVAWKSKRGS
jgi:hypothetical protein